MSGRELRDYVADVWRYAETAVRLVGERDLDDLAADERTALALERAIEIVGEAASKLPPEYRAQHPDIPWREMVGLRNRLAHGYFATEIGILHRVARILLPPLIELLRALAEAEGALQTPQSGTGKRP